MINLIPSSAKKSLLTEYWVRVSSTWLILWSIAFFVGASILYPAYVLIGSQVSVHEDSAKIASQKVASYESVSAALTRTSLQAKVIIDELSGTLFSKYITLFENLQGSGIQLNKIQLSRTNLMIKPVLIEGVASDRQSLASFRDRLLSVENVKSADLPISNLASDKDIQFSITVTFNNVENEV